jgi:hypothetical protein
VAEAAVGSAAPDPILREGANEREVRLSEHWREAPVVAVFLRHFG